jgi:acyl carrier protein
MTSICSGRRPAAPAWCGSCSGPGWPGPGASADAPSLGRLLAAERVTVAAFTPAALLDLVETGALGGAALRTVLCGGDTLPGDLPGDFADACPGTRLCNVYSAREGFLAAVGECADGGGRHPVPAGLQVCVLDPRQHPVPPGVPGEVYLGGEALARGYWNRPAETAEAFVPHPSGTAGERLFRTGDLARLRPDGALEFLGRRDRQVNLRGFRFDLGEVEAVLGQHPAVAAAAAAVREDARGERQLVVYAVARYGRVPAADLRAFFKERVPDYAVPSAFTWLPGLPLLPNGKVDRAALPAPERAETAEPFVAPRTPAEQTIAAAWAEVLRLDRVGIHDNFFNLGGHSLAATQVASRLRKAFGRDVPLRSLFQAPTIAELAPVIARLQAAGAGAPAAIKVLPRGARRAAAALAGQ